MAMVMSAFVPVLISSLEETLKDWRLHGWSAAAREEGERLKTSMKVVEKFLEDAEKKRIHDRSVERWLARLRQAAYDADQLLESFKIEVEAAPRWKIQIAQYFGPIGTLKSVKRNISRLNQIMSDISKSIPSTLTATDKRTEQLRNSAHCADSMYSSNLDGTDVNIEIISALVEKLVEEDRLHVQKNKEVDRRHPVLLLAVCGMGGIGKTTIARKMFHDQRIKSAFSTCLWVPISKGFTHTDVLSATIRAAGQDLKGSETVNERRKLLAKIVRGKRIFLVLNVGTSPRNVHFDTEYGKMHLSLIDTLHILCASAQGSRVLMTTRDEDGAVKLVQKEKILGERLVVQIHRIPRLTVDHGWMLLQKTACLEPPKIIEDASEVEITTVKKCNGLPLAVKIVGGVLRRKNCTLQVWRSVCGSQAFSFKDLPEGTEGLMGSICLSYQDAVPQVKQCLLYLSLFPMDFVIDHHFITQLLISEGLFDTRDLCYSEMVHGYINTSSYAANWQNNDSVSTGNNGVDNSQSLVERADECNSRSLEETVDNYFKELLERKLLQQSQDRKGYMMHERVWSFAQYLTTDEVHAGNLKHMDELPASLRRVFFINMGLTSIPGDIGRLRSLRTLILSGNPLNDNGLETIFMNLKFLQVLDLANTEVKSIPITLGNLVHLRHLDLSQAKIEGLPESIGRLRRLRFLGMRSCTNLSSLPINIQKLPKLEYLNLRDTKIPKTPPRLRNSKHLTFLHGFIVVDKSSYGWPLDELKDMGKLRNLHLKIEKDVDTDCEVPKNMPNLKTLELCCTIGDSQGLVQQSIEKIFIKLHPCPCLQSLKIHGNCGGAYPQWLSATELPNLQRLDLLNCKFLGSLPPLCHFQNLKFLTLTGISKLQTIDMQGSAIVPSLVNLEELHIEDMQELESLSAIEAGSLPLLQKLTIINCPKLKLLMGALHHCKMLTVMEIRNAGLLEVVENILSLKELVVEQMPHLTRLSNLPLLKVLTVIRCPNLEQVTGVNSLRHIHIEDELLVQLPKFLEPLASRIETLDIVGTAELLSRCERNMHDWYIVREIAHVYAYLPGRLPFFQYTRSSDFFSKQQRQMAHEHNSPSEPPAGVEKRFADGGVTSSSTSSGGNNNSPSQTAHQSHQTYRPSALVGQLLIGLILMVNITASHRDPFEEFCLVCLYFFAAFSSFFVRWRQ